jgi:hypothetical protein
MAVADLMGGGTVKFGPSGVSGGGDPTIPLMAYAFLAVLGKPMPTGACQEGFRHLAYFKVVKIMKHISHRKYSCRMQYLFGANNTKILVEWLT